MALLHFQVGLNLHVIPKHVCRGLESPRQLLPPFEGEHLEQRADKPAGTYMPPKGKPLGSHMVGWKYTSTMIGWIIGGRVH